MKRIDFILANSGICSRSEARELVAKKRVTVNGSLVMSPSEKVDENAEIAVDGIILATEKYVYLMLNKPSGYICSTEGADCVLTLLPKEFYRKGLFPVGRLDKDTEGLLLITNDGDFAHAVTAPSRKIEKLYRAELKSPVTEEDILAFAAGMNAKNGEKFAPAILETGDGNDLSKTAFVTVFEGKYHEVKRMFLLRGNEVLKLERLKIGGLSLDKTLKKGESRFLSENEKESIFTAAPANVTNI